MKLRIKFSSSDEDLLIIDEDSIKNPYDTGDDIYDEGTLKINKYLINKLGKVVYGYIDADFDIDEDKLKIDDNPVIDVGFKNSYERTLHKGKYDGKDIYYEIYSDMGGGSNVIYSPKKLSIKSFAG
jgi:hypothetical protein